MEFPRIILILFTTACLLHTASAEAQIYQPECTTLEQAVQSINQVQSPELQAINCSRNANCNGFSCVVTFQEKRTELSVKLHPCDDPPQMLLLIQDPDTNLPYFEETITHGDTYPIPGLEYLYRNLFTVRVAIRVQFEQVADGFQIGLNLVLQLEGFDLSQIALLPPTVINTPPCPTQGPAESLQCIRMEQLVDGLNPPLEFHCLKNEDCRGFRCSGTIQFGPASIPVEANSVLDSCTEPISYNISLLNGNSILWSHSFIRSSNVLIEGRGIQLPPGFEANMNVTMEPFTEDIDYFLTTIQLTITCQGSLCGDETFLHNDRVPIPPCDHPRTTSIPVSISSLTPIPGAGDECSTFHSIAADIPIFGVVEGDGRQCQANGPDRGPCDGFMCSLKTNDHSFIYKLKLFHCETPVRVFFTVDDQDPGHNYHVAQNISGNKVVPLDGVFMGLKIKIVVARRMSDAVELDITLEVPTEGGEPATVPLVQDRLVPVPPCTPMTPGPTDTVSNPPKVTKPAVATDSTSNKLTTASAKVTKPDDGGKNGGKKDGGDKDKLTGPGISDAATIAIPVVIVAIVVITVIIVGVIWYRRRPTSSNDHIHLVENSTPPL